MKSKTYPIFHIDGRRARTLRKDLGLPSDLKDLDEDTTTEITQIELALVAETLNLPRLKYDHLADSGAFLCGGALTAWIGSYPPSDYDFFFPALEMAERLHQRLLYEGAVLDGYQVSMNGSVIHIESNNGRDFTLTLTQAGLGVGLIPAIAMEMGAFSIFLYCVRARDVVYDRLEELTGARVTHAYCRVGGVKAKGSSHEAYGCEKPAFLLCSR